MRITLNRIFVSDPAKALRFYTEVLGLVRAARGPWSTSCMLVSPLDPQGLPLQIEAGDTPFARRYQQLCYEHGVPATAFEVEDLQAETARLKKLGVCVMLDPLPCDALIKAFIDDGCGNLIELVQRLPTP